MSEWVKGGWEEDNKTPRIPEVMYKTEFGFLYYKYGREGGFIHLASTSIHSVIPILRSTWVMNKHLDGRSMPFDWYFYSIETPNPPEVP